MLQGLEKNPKLINVGPTFIPDYRVLSNTLHLHMTHLFQDGEPLAPPPPEEEEAPAGSSFLPPENPKTYGNPEVNTPIQKECQLVRETKNTGSPMCFLEPECESKCQQVPKETCTNVQKEQCQTYNEQACNTVYEQKCDTVYETKYKNQCKTVPDKKCETM